MFQGAYIEQSPGQWVCRTNKTLAFTYQPLHSDSPLEQHLAVAIAVARGATLSSPIILRRSPSAAHAPDRPQGSGQYCRALLCTAPASLPRAPPRL